MYLQSKKGEIDMITMYERTKKDNQNLYGVNKIASTENPFIERPCLLCISAQDMHMKSVFGIIREGMQAARLRTTQEDGPGYDIKDFPASFLGMTFQKDDRYENSGIELAERYLEPIIEEDGNRISIEEAKKKMRNINIMTYCNGTETYLIAEEKLQKKMTALGYTEQEQKEILSQISLTTIGTMQNTSEIKATCINFMDTMDEEVMTPISQRLQKWLEETNQKKALISITENSAIFCFSGSGNHALREYFENDCLAKLPISILICSSLNNGIYNQKAADFMPLMYSDVENIIDSEVLSEEEITQEEQLKRFDNQLNYVDAKKFSKEEISLLNEIDILCKEKQKVDKQNQTLKTDLSRSKEKYQGLEDAVKQNTNLETYYKILEQGTGYQIPVSVSEEIKESKKH